jgi:hypothetical protein
LRSGVHHLAARSSGGVCLPQTHRHSDLPRRYAAIAVADQADYLGGWGFAVAIRGIGKAIVDDSAYGGIMRVVDDYAQPVSVSLAELQGDPKGVVTRLLGRLYRGMGVQDFILASDLIPRGFLA